MGSKITIDSSTLMNKGLEVIEARWLFDVDYDQIDVLVHKESIIHSMIQYRDSSVMAQLGLPDMKLPILYALSYPERLSSPLARLDLSAVANLSFEAPDFERFPCLELAYRAGRMGGSATTVLNAANEILVAEFLKGNIDFYDISSTIDTLLSRHQVILDPSYEDILAIDEETRQRVIKDFSNRQGVSL
jgi:1-deoxy-D-xylulose-5-phosphate reductoisomerase